MPYRKSNAKPVYRRKSNYTRRAVAPKKAFAKKVLRIVRRQEEVKVFTRTGTFPINLYNTGTANVSSVVILNSTTGGLLSDGSGIVQGVTQNDRIGDKINIASLNMRCTMTFNNSSTAVTTQPTHVRVFLIKDKMNLSSLIGSTLFENDNPPTNKIIDQLQPFNKDRFVVYWQRKYKLGSSNTGVGGSPLTMGNNDYKLNQMFTVPMTKMFKNFTFNKVSGFIQTPSNVYLAFLPCHADDSAYTNGDITLNYAISCHFRDS